MRTAHKWLVIAGLLAGAAAAWLAVHRTFVPYQTAPAALGLLVGWSFIGSGLAASRVRPENPLGKVMVLTGFAWFATFLTDAHASALFTLGAVVQNVYLVGLAYLIISFPSGRLQGRPERLVIWAAVGLVSVVQVMYLLFGSSTAVLCSRCPANGLDVGHEDAVGKAILQAQRISGVVVALLVLAVVATRWRRASAVQRRYIAPMAWAGALTLGALVVMIANNVLNDPLGQTPKRVLDIVLASLPIAMLFVLVQRRLARAAVAGLVVELGEREVATDLQRALARALGDSSLEVAYWFPAGSRYVDSDGQPFELPPGGSDRVTTVVERGGERIAALVHDPALEENAELIDSVCAAAAMTLENQRLQAELRARLGELQASRTRLVAATEAERTRIERDLHDGTQQRLVSLAMSLGLLETKLTADPEAAKPIAQEARAALAVALEELRELSHGIHPAVLTDRGLKAALEELADRGALPVYLDISIDERPCPAVEAAAYFVVSEALTNAVKHSHAHEVRVVASCEHGSLTVEVSDDGIGGAAPHGGSGLRGLADRVEALGGTLVVLSPVGRGTTLRAELPDG